MQTIMVLNAKGGSGKTTLVTNIAGYYAAQEKVVVIKDYDPQGSATEWLALRDYSFPRIHGLVAYKPVPQYTTRAWQMRLPENTDRVIVDTPAGVDLTRFAGMVKAVDKILIPVSSSGIEVRATLAFIKKLKKFMGLYSCSAEIGVVANRVDTNMACYHSMLDALEGLGMSCIASLSYSDSYLKSAEGGESILELDHSMIAKDKFEWAPLINWLEDDVVMKPSVASEECLSNSNAEERKLYVVAD